MSEPRTSTASTDFADLVQTWVDGLRSMSEESVDRGERLIDEMLLTGGSREEFGKTWEQVRGLVAAARDAASRGEALSAHLQDVEAEWVAANRWTEMGVADLQRALEQELERSPERGARRWLHEIFDALRADERLAATNLATMGLPFPEELREGVDVVRTGLQGWFGGSSTAGMILFERVAEGDLPAWSPILDAETRSRAHRLAAFVALRQLSDSATAERHVVAAVETTPFNPRAYVDRAGFFLSGDDAARAAQDAEHAIELAPEDPAGYLMLGACSESTAQFDESRTMYRRGLQLMPTEAIARIANQMTMTDPSGAELVVAAGILLERNRPKAALALADAALRVGVRDSVPYPDAETHRIRLLALERSDGSPTEIASAATEAGKRLLWSNRPDEAIPLFRRAMGEAPSLREAGWLYADALTSRCFPAGAPKPDERLLTEAVQEWEAWAAKVGQPGEDENAFAWAYLTRAILADFQAYFPAEDLQDRHWDALAYSERSLVHNMQDGQRWGFVSKYLRTLQLDELSLEANDVAYALSPGDQVVLEERVALLANAGEFSDAEAVGKELRETYGMSPWLSGALSFVAIFHKDYERALELLDAPLNGGYDLRFYLGLRARCHLGLDDVESARADFRMVRDLMDEPLEDEVRMLAEASTALGDLPEAERLLKEAWDEAREYLFLGTDAYLKFAKGEDEAALLQLSRAIDISENLREVDDVIGDIRLLLKTVEADGRDLSEVKRGVAALEEGPAANRRATLKRGAPAPDDELAEALSDEPHEGGSSGRDLTPALVALVSVRARRLAARGDDRAAADAYGRLLGSTFEPEATIAFARALARVNQDLIGRGDVDGVKEVQERLRSQGIVDDVEEAVAVASALQAAQRTDEAADQLAHAVAAVPRDDQRQSLLQRLGELDLVRRRWADAQEHFTSALDIARARNDDTKIGQLELRLSLTAASGGDFIGAASHGNAAWQAWAQAGSVDPKRVITDETIALTQSLGAEGVMGTLSEALKHLPGNLGNGLASDDAGPSTPA